MGQKGSKERLSKSDMEFLKTSTRYDEDTIKEWYKKDVSAAIRIC